MDDPNKESGICPICDKEFKVIEIERHVNKCIFLNSVDTKGNESRKRPPPSPILSNNAQPQRRVSFTQKSPRHNFSTHNSETAQSMDKSSDNIPSSSADQPETSRINDLNYKKGEPKTQKNKFSFNTPLAKQLQPKSLDDFIGQSHIFGKKSILRTLIENREIPNMILWGPPGCGKTSLSAVINEVCKSNPSKLKFVSLCAATAGVKDVQSVISVARNDLKFKRKTVLFMDEIHRFNKKQQDTFLLSVEKGEIILIGATTENPSFTINNALLSRCRVIVLEKLQPTDLLMILQKAAESLNIDVVDDENPCLLGEDNSEGLALTESALKWLADISDGDARIALNNLEIIIQHHNTSNVKKTLTVDDLKDAIKKSHLLYDRKGEEHYNIISAMHKSIRGSDANAALYWTTRMIVSGEDPLFIARRMVRAASEDIGNADPNALQLAIATMQGCQLLGMPECDCLLAQCAIYLARAPKSREADSALGKAKRIISECEGIQPSVPLHIRNAPTKLMRDLGYGQRSGEDLSFMPPELKNVHFFE